MEDPKLSYWLLLTGVAIGLALIFSTMRVTDALNQQEHKPEDDQPFFEKCQAHHFDLEQCRFFRYGLHDPRDAEKE